MSEEGEMIQQNGRKETIAPFLAQATNRGIEMEEEWNALKELLTIGEEGDIDARAEVNSHQQIQFARARRMAEHYQWNHLGDFVTDVLTLSLSLNRKSRIEFTHAIRAITSNGMDEQMGFWERMQKGLNK